MAAYTPVAVSVPIYSGGRITGTRSEIYYEQGGTETLTPETEVVKYVECTIQPFDNSVIIRAFGIDPSATYDQFKITYGEAIQKMANALKMTRRTAAPCGSTSLQRHCRWWARSHISGAASRRPAGTMLGTRRGW